MRCDNIVGTAKVMLFRAFYYVVILKRQNAFGNRLLIGVNIFLKAFCYDLS